VTGSCEYGIEPSGSIKCWVTEQVVASQGQLCGVCLLRNCLVLGPEISTLQHKS
jgi:hypothetical protein